MPKPSRPMMDSADLPGRAVVPPGDSTTDAHPAFPTSSGSRWPAAASVPRAALGRALAATVGPDALPPFRAPPVGPRGDGALGDVGASCARRAPSAASPWSRPCRSHPTQRPPRSCRSRWPLRARSGAAVAAGRRLGGGARRHGPGAGCPAATPARSRRRPAAGGHGQPAPRAGRARAGARPGAPLRRRRPLRPGADATAEAALRAAGIDELLPHAHVLPARPGRVPSASGAVWTRLPVAGRAQVPGGFEQPTVRLAVDGAPAVELTSVHTAPPATSPAAVRAWAEDLAALPAPAPDVLRVLAGDFNATFDHAALRAVLAPRVRRRRPGRWAGPGLDLAAAPAAVPPARPGPRAGRSADHAWPRSSSCTVSGSDHRAVVAELVLPSG